MPSTLWTRKPIDTGDDANSAKERLPRSLGARGLTSLGVGGIIGTGIFVMIGVAAHEKAGPAITLSFIIAALACAAVALCYVEFATVVPEAGSAYSYAYATLGELPGWLVGWNVILCYGIAGASVAQGWSHYFQAFLGGLHVRLPALITQTPMDFNGKGGFALTGGVGDMPALLITLVLTALIIRGLKTSLQFNFVMLCVKVSVILFVVVAGTFYINPQNWHPFAPFGLFMSPNAAGESVGMIAGAALAFYAFMGFEALSAYAEECKDPQRDVPIGVLSSVGICTLVYVSVSLVLTGMVRYDQINLRAPISSAFRQVGLPWAEFLVSVGALTGITSVLLMIVMTLPRILMTMGRDGLLSHRIFCNFHPRFQTPWKAMLATGIGVAIFGTWMPLRMLADLVTLATLAGYVVICAAVLVLRHTLADRPRRFRVPLGPVVPLFGMGACALLIRSLPPLAWAELGIWLLIGIVIYFGYSRKHSVLANSPSQG